MAIDRQSMAAMYLRGVLDELIEQKRRSLERPGYDYDKTQFLRGELAAFRKIYGEVAITPPSEDESEDG